MDTADQFFTLRNTSPTRKRGSGIGNSRRIPRLRVGLVFASNDGKSSQLQELIGRGRMEPILASGRARNYTTGMVARQIIARYGHALPVGVVSREPDSNCQAREKMCGRIT